MTRFMREKGGMDERSKNDYRKPAPDRVFWSDAAAEGAARPQTNSVHQVCHDISYE